MHSHKQHSYFVIFESFLVGKKERWDKTASERKTNRTLDQILDIEIPLLYDLN